MFCFFDSARLFFVALLVLLLLMFVAVWSTVLHLLLFGLHYCATCTHSYILFGYTSTLDREASIRFAHMYVMVVLRCWREKHIEVQHCLHVVLTRCIKANI